MLVEMESQQVEDTGSARSHTAQTQVLAPLEPADPSICIPRTFANITDARVQRVFDQVLGAKCVERVDMVPQGSGDGSFQRVFVHLTAWPANEQSRRMRQKLIDGKDVKLVYDEPWFWKCRASRSAKPTEPRSVPRAPYIADSDDD